MITIISILICITSLGYWYNKILKIENIHKNSIVSFGEKKHPSSKIIISNEKKALFYEYLKQQRYSFTLLWLSLLIAIILISVLFGRLIFNLIHSDLI